jgi:type I restriction enzyme S subunit
MFEPWPIDPLGNHCSVRARIGWRGLASSEYTSDGPFLIAGKHVRNGQIDWATCDHITDFRYHESMEIALTSGDVVLTKDGTIGRVARIDHLPGRATLNGTMMLLRSGNQLDYRFLFHLLTGDQFKKLIADKVSGSSIPHIFQRDMVTLPISIPPMKQQLGIADVLDTLDTTIRQTELIIEKLKQVKQGLLHDLLTRGIDANGALRPLQSQAPHLYKDSPLGWVPLEWNVVG